MNIPNQEHLEAERAVVDKKLKDYVSTLPKEGQEKFKAVNDALEILTKAGVQAYIFPMLPSEEIGNSDGVYQFNSIEKLATFDDSGQFTEEFKDKNRLYYSGLISAFYHHFKLLRCFEGETLEEEFGKFSLFVASRMKDFAEYYHKERKKHNDGTEE